VDQVRPEKCGKSLKPPNVILGESEGVSAPHNQGSRDSKLPLVLHECAWNSREVVAMNNLHTRFTFLRMQLCCSLRYDWAQHYSLLGATFPKLCLNTPSKLDTSPPIPRLQSVDSLEHCPRVSQIAKEKAPLGLGDIVGQI